MVLYFLGIDNSQLVLMGLGICCLIVCCIVGCICKKSVKHKQDAKQQKQLELSNVAQLNSGSASPIQTSP